MPSGAWAAGGVAAAVASAWLAVGLHRRRRLRLRPPRSGLTVSELPTAPDVVRALDAGSRSLPLATEPAESQTVGAGEISSALDDLWREPDAPTAAPVATDRRGHTVSLGDLAHAGPALSGIGALSAGRALLATSLTANSTYPEIVYRTRLVLTQDAVTALLPAGRELTPAADAERLRISPTLDQAIDTWEQDVSEHCQYRQTTDGAPLTTRADDDLPAPLLLIAVDVSIPASARIRAVLTTAAHCPVGAFLLDTTAPGPAFTVADDGQLASLDTHAPAAEPAASWDGGRISTLSTDDLDAILGLLPVEEHHDHTGPAASDRADLLPVQAEPAAAPPHTELDEAGPQPPAAPDRPLATLHLLGRPQVTPPASRTAITGIRTDSYVVVLDLVLHPNGRTLDQLAAALAPDGDPRSTKARVRTAITSFRARLRAHTDPESQPGPQPAFITHTNGVYRLDPDVLAVDLWRLHNHLATAIDPGTERHRQIRQLMHATDLYRGDLADGLGQQWIDAWRDETRRTVIEALARLAELLDADDKPDHAISALEDASRHDPLNEELAVRIMRIQAARHRPDGVRHTYQRLEQRVFDTVGTYPSIELETLRDELIQTARQTGDPDRWTQRPRSAHGTR